MVLKFYLGHYCYKIKYHIEAKEPIDLNWNCDYCDKEHSGNLMKKLKNVELEYNLTSFIPDVALLDKANNVFAVIEVVVTNKPDDKKIEFYKDNEIILIQFNLNSDLDILKLNESALTPDKLDLCVRPKCNKYKTLKALHVIDDYCWKCEEPIKVGVITTDSVKNTEVSTLLLPNDFNNQDVEFVLSKGVILNYQYIRRKKRNELVNTCKSCNSFIGEYYLRSEYFFPSIYESISYEEFTMGYHCFKCESTIDTKR